MNTLGLVGLLAALGIRSVLDERRRGRPQTTAAAGGTRGMEWVWRIFEHEVTLEEQLTWAWAAVRAAHRRQTSEAMCDNGWPSTATTNP